MQLNNPISEKIAASDSKKIKKRKHKTIIPCVIATIAFAVLSTTIYCMAIGSTSSDKTTHTQIDTTIPTVVLSCETADDSKIDIQSDIEANDGQVVETEPAETEPIDIRPDFFDKNITFRINYIYPSDTMPYALISPMEYGKVIRDENMPLIVWLHGSGEKNVNPYTFFQQGLPAVFDNWSLEGFRAYIICPQLTGDYNTGAWYLPKSAENLNNLLTQFISEYDIDTENIIIMGHSLGGQGALYMAHHFNGEIYPDLFSKCVVLSGYNPQYSENDPVDITEINIPVISYIGTAANGEDSGSIHYSLGQLAPVIGESSVISLDCNHGAVPSVALNLDEDHNGRSDVIEWCFGMNRDNKIDGESAEADCASNITDMSSTQNVYNAVPLYFQTDYPNVRYSQGSLATSGCGISCFSMVATYLLDKEYTPDKLARFTDSSYDNVSRFEKCAQSLGITWERSYNWEDTVNALKNGYVAIALVNSNTPFTENGHFIVLTGITSDEKILVNDPNKNNYNRMKTQYETGFDQSSITCGFCGAWLFKKD